MTVCGMANRLMNFDPSNPVTFLEESIGLDNKNIALSEEVTVEIIDSNDSQQDIKHPSQKKRSKSSIQKFPLAVSSYSKPMVPVDRKKKTINQTAYEIDGNASLMHIPGIAKLPSTYSNSGVDLSAHNSVTTPTKLFVSPYCHDAILGSANVKHTMEEPSSTGKRSGRRKRPPSRYIDYQKVDSVSEKTVTDIINQDVCDTSDAKNQHDESDNLTPECFPLKRQRTRKSLIDYSGGKINKKLKAQGDKMIDPDVEGDSHEQVDAERCVSVIKTVESHSDDSPPTTLGLRHMTRIPKNGESGGTYKGRHSDPVPAKNNPSDVNVDSEQKTHCAEDLTLHDTDDKVSISSDASAETTGASSHSRGRPRKRGKSKTGASPKTADSAVKEAIKCGVCLREFNTLNQFKRHTFVEHNGLARPYGENEPFTEKEERELQHQCIKAVGRLQCLIPTCSRTFTTVGGYLYHMNICGREKEREMITCELCGRLLIPASLKSHMRSYHPPTPPPAVKEEGGRGKRAAAKRALVKVSKIAKQIKEEPVENSADEDYVHETDDNKTSDEADCILSKEKLYLEPEKVHISKEMFKEWKDDLEKNGFVLCKNKGCVKSMNSMKTVRFHYQTCPNSTHSGLYTCIICQYSCSNRMTIQKHVDVHKMACAATPTNANEELEFLYRASLPANQTKRKGTRFNLGSSQIYQSIRLGEFDERLFTPHIEFAIQFYRNNYVPQLYSNWLPLSSHWKLVLDRESVPFIPSTKESAEFRNSYVVEGGGQSQSVEWEQLKLFSASRFDSQLTTCFVGGPIWAVAWCPTPHSIPCQQYIAVSSHLEMDATFLCSKICNTPGLLQLWDIGLLEGGSNGANPKFCLGIAHEFGAAWSMSWCPSGCWEDPNSVEDRLPRLGLLAAACADGFVRIYSVPHPCSLYGDEDEELPIFEATACVVLSLAKISEGRNQLQCTALSWHQGKDHVYIAGGFSNGLVGIWNLATESPLLKVQQSSTIDRIYTQLAFRAHGTLITGLDFSHLHNGQYLVTVSRDRCVKFWDVHDVTLPYNVMRKRISTGVKWPPHWCGVYTYGDYCYNMVGNCASYLECGYFGEISMNLASHNTCILDASPSYWLNSLVSCDVAGEVVIAVIGHLMQNSNYQKISNHRRLPLYRIEPVKCASLHTGDDASSENSHEANASSNSNAKTPQKNYEIKPMFYSEATKTYKLHYKNASLGDLKAIPMQELRHISSSNYMETGNVDEYPLAAVNRVAWNSNLGAHAWIAAGEQSGMLRFIYVKSLDILSIEKARNSLSTGASYIPEALKGTPKGQKA